MSADRGAIELRSPLGFEPDICFEGAEKTSREWGINAADRHFDDDVDVIRRIFPIETASIRK